MSAVVPTSSPIWSLNGAMLSGLNDWDRYGHSVALAGDVNADGASDVIVGAPQYHMNSGVQTTGKGYAQVILGGSLTTIQLRGEQEGSRFGEAVAGNFDIDGGGDEVIVGAPFFDDPANPNLLDVGKAYVWSHAQPVGYVRTHLGVAIPWVVDEETIWIGEQRGWGLTDVGDIDGDTREEYAVGSYAFSEPEQSGACGTSPAPCAGNSSTRWRRSIRSIGDLRRRDRLSPASTDRGRPERLVRRVGLWHRGRRQRRQARSGDLGVSLVPVPHQPEPA